MRKNSFESLVPKSVFWISSALTWYLFSDHIFLKAERFCSHRWSQTPRNSTWVQHWYFLRRNALFWDHERRMRFLCQTESEASRNLARPEWQTNPFLAHGVSVFLQQNINWYSNISTYDLRFYLLLEQYQGLRWKHFACPCTLQQYLGAIPRSQANHLLQL